jgi:predicted N-acetyltransferase YhbS
MMNALEIRIMHPSEAKQVALVNSIAYQNDPPMVAIHQSQGEELRKRLEKTLIDMYTNTPQETFIAIKKDRIIGSIRSQLCTGQYYSGHSYSEGEYDHIITNKLEELSFEQRMKWWIKTCESHDITIPHSHVGPFAVLPEFQSKGVGSRLLDDYLSRLGGVPSYLETFTVSNASYYEKRGYKVLKTDSVLGLTGFWLFRE